MNRPSSSIVGTPMDRVDGLVAAAVVAFVVGWLHSGGASPARGALVW